MTIHRERGFEPARVVAEHRGGYYVLDDRDEARVRGRLRDTALRVAAGRRRLGCGSDAQGEQGGDRGRASAPDAGLAQDPWLRAEEQVVAANVDTVFSSPASSAT